MERESLPAFLAILAMSPLWILLTRAPLSRLCPRTPAQLVAVAAGLAGAGPTALLTCTVASLFLGLGFEQVKRPRSCA